MALAKKSGGFQTMIEKPKTFVDALRLFCTPPRTSALRREQELAATGTRFNLEFRDYQLVGHQWGSAPRLLLLHGWGGRGLQFSGLIGQLAETLGVVCIDFPAHGESGGDHCHALMVAEMIHDLQDRFPSLNLAVAHSYGLLGLSIAMSEGAEFERVAVLAGLTMIPQRFMQFAESVGYTPDEIIEFFATVDQEFGVGRLNSISPWQLAGRFKASALILHDPADTDVDVNQARLLVKYWPGARLELLEGVGHHRIVRDRQAIQRVVEFLDGAEPDQAADGLQDTTQ